MKTQTRSFYFFCGVVGLISAAAIAFLNPGQRPLIGFLSAALLVSVCLLILGWLWRKLAGNRSLAWATFLSFLLRLFIGMLLFITLPVFGYDEDPTNAGYLYLDAYRRDGDAWRLAQSEDSLSSAFQAEFATDQYGGLLSLSAAVYRLISPDGHRPLLILILTSFVYAFGLPFLWKALLPRWGERTANLTAWFYALYPESVILGASQMREPMIIGLSAIAIWGVMDWRKDHKRALATMLASLLGILFLSFKAAEALLVALIIWFWLENIQPNSKRTGRILAYTLLAVSLLSGILWSGSWLLDSSKYDLYLMESSSGRIQWEVELIGEKYRTPFIIAYGLAQPVLPAAIVYPGIAINRAISIFRALGWYLLVPMLITALLLLWKETKKEIRYQLLFLLGAAAIWMLVSSARAGGDQWDNPRYRSIFLIWMLIPAAWACVTTLAKRSPWLWRLLFLEFFYIAFFIQWYLSRYYGLFKRMNFWPMVRLLAGVGGLVIGGGLVFDLIKKKIMNRRKPGA